MIVISRSDRTVHHQFSHPCMQRKNVWWKHSCCLTPCEHDRFSRMHPSHDMASPPIPFTVNSCVSQQNRCIRVCSAWQEKILGCAQRVHRKEAAPSLMRMSFEVAWSHPHGLPALSRLMILRWLQMKWLVLCAVGAPQGDCNRAGRWRPRRAAPSP